MIAYQQNCLTLLKNDNFTNSPIAAMLNKNNITTYREVRLFYKSNSTRERGMVDSGNELLTKLRKFTLLFSTEILTDNLGLPLDDSSSPSTDSLNKSIELILILDKFV